MRERFTTSKTKDVTEWSFDRCKEYPVAWFEIILRSTTDTERQTSWVLWFEGCAVRMGVSLFGLCHVHDASAQTKRP